MDCEGDAIESICLKKKSNVTAFKMLIVLAYTYALCLTWEDCVISVGRNLQPLKDKFQITCLSVDAAPL
jgi:hypothetical protein